MIVNMDEKQTSSEKQKQKQTSSEKQTHKSIKPVKKKTIKKSSNYFCGNCGKKGHIYRKCVAPIISLGVIVYRLNSNGEREYLMIRRKDTLGFVEFMRGKYNLTNYSYIYTLFSIMTEQERQKILENDYDTLWGNLWMNKNTKQYHNEYDNSRKRFNKLKAGYKTKDNKIISLKSIHESQPILWTEPEWGFPKGRRNSREKDKECAMREFREETGLNDSDYNLEDNFGRIEETFYGTNNIRYKHIYFIGKWTSNKIIKVDKNNLSQICEIGDISWFTYEEGYKKIRKYNIEKKRLLKNLEYELNDIKANIKNNIKL
jgi:8-oxo-dGTP pyrophosphatase MutT (NUDIX family)